MVFLCQYKIDKHYNLAYYSIRIDSEKGHFVLAVHLFFEGKMTLFMMCYILSFVIPLYMYDQVGKLKRKYKHAGYRGPGQMLMNIETGEPAVTKTLIMEGISLLTLVTFVGNIFLMKRMVGNQLTLFHVTVIMLPFMVFGGVGMYKVYKAK